MWMRTLLVGSLLIVVISDGRRANSQAPVPQRAQQSAPPGQTNDPAQPRAETPHEANQKSPPLPLSTVQELDPGTRAVRERERKREVEILEKLAKPISLEHAETPLKAVLDELRKALGLEISYDVVALRDAAIDPSATPVTLSVRDVSGRAALQTMLEEWNLDWVIRNESLWITTLDKANTSLTTKVYKVGDLVVAEGDKEVDFDSLIGMVKSTISPQTWSESGGAGKIAGFGDGQNSVLVVSQTRCVHEEVLQLLTDLRAAGARTAKKVVVHPSGSILGSMLSPGISVSAPNGSRAQQNNSARGSRNK
jgi:hypothetical protein